MQFPTAYSLLQGSIMPFIIMTQAPKEKSVAEILKKKGFRVVRSSKAQGMLVCSDSPPADIRSLPGVVGVLETSEETVQRLSVHGRKKGRKRGRCGSRQTGRRRNRNGRVLRRLCGYCQGNKRRRPGFSPSERLWQRSSCPPRFKKSQKRRDRRDLAMMAKASIESVCVLEKCVSVRPGNIWGEPRGHLAFKGRQR